MIYELLSTVASPCYLKAFIIGCTVIQYGNHDYHLITNKCLGDSVYVHTQPLSVLPLVAEMSAKNLGLYG